ncbi:PAS fold-containing protein [Spirosoma endophyticum]|uniref:Sensory/regulatory protein RpfC n=2 Tax=Spirosoma endophyticum TaxID=662367 RepID=A0A1I1PZK1_9BACT|nr:PAS fold-containing protein [Spirosoma endophyticum]
MIATGLLITVIIGVNARQTLKQLIKMNNWVVHTHLVLNKTQHLLALLTNLDNDLRAYLLSNNAYFKHDFDRSTEEMKRELKALQALTVDNPIQKKRIQSLDKLLETKLTRSHYLFKTGVVKNGMARLDSIEQLLSISRKFDQVLKATDSYENVLLETRTAQSKRSAEYATISNLIGAITALAMILWAMYLISLALRNSNRINQKLSESEQQLKTLLEAVPVPVVIVDRYGKVYLANGAATQLFSNLKDFDSYAEMTNSVMYYRFPHGEPYPIEQRPTYRALQGEASRVDDLEMRINGKAIQLLCSSSPVYNADGDLEYVVTSSIDISDRVQSLQRLQEAKELAEKAVKLKENFLANMSHEIRTPLNAMLGFSELLGTTVLDDEQKEFIGLIRTAGKNLLTIINDILDISKIEAGMIRLESIPFSIQLLTGSIKTMFQPTAADKNLHLTVETDPDLPPVFLGDPTRLTQILLNLLSNAIKFTKKGGVTLRVEKGESTTESVRVRIIVQDTGIGIESEALPHIFERFQQANNFTTRYYGGTGLGLNIVKSLSELQGGSIIVDSTVGEGSRFTIEIPYLIAKEQINLDQTQRSTGKNPSERDVRVLVVEDNLMNQKLVLQVLKRLGYQAKVADDGQRALDMLQETAFDVILMDIQMPIMDGYETTRQIRSKFDKTVPIIAMTAHALASEQEECLKAGMNDFLSKPFKMEELQQLIRKYLPVTNLAATVTPQNELTAKPLSNFSAKLLLEAVGNDLDLAIELLEIYVSQTPDEIEKLQLALDQQDIATVGKLIHTQKVHTKMLGMSRATQLILDTEALVRKDGDIEGILPLMKQYMIEIKEVLPHITLYLKSMYTTR